MNTSLFLGSFNPQSSGISRDYIILNAGRIRIMPRRYEMCCGRVLFSNRTNMDKLTVQHKWKSTSGLDMYLAVWLSSQY